MEKEEKEKVAKEKAKAEKGMRQEWQRSATSSKDGTTKAMEKAKEDTNRTNATSVGKEAMWQEIARPT